MCVLYIPVFTRPPVQFKRLTCRAAADVAAAEEEFDDLYFEDPRRCRANFTWPFTRPCGDPLYTDIRQAPVDWCQAKMVALHPYQI